MGKAQRDDPIPVINQILGDGGRWFKSASCGAFVKLFIEQMSFCLTVTMEPHALIKLYCLIATQYLKTDRKSKRARPLT